MTPVNIRPEAEIRVAAESAFKEHRQRVLKVLSSALVEHVGSTSIPGALTKGDVDLLVRVEAGRFEAAIAALRRLYVVNQRENWTPTYASFAEAEATAVPVGVQLAVVGSADEALFTSFRDALIRDPALLAEYNALKLRHDGEGYERYTKVKGEFVERVLADATQSSPR
ncbi:MAG: GrpB family protein [Actinomycetota bacterium]|nr:GrpB family protein [Actinomycetota bacterium]